MVYSEQTPEQNEENWFKIVGEGGDEDVKPENSLWFKVIEN